MHVALFQKDMRNFAISREFKTRAFAAAAAAAAAAADATAAVDNAPRPKPCAKSSKGGKGSEGVPKLRSPWPSSELSSEHTLGGQPRNSTPAVLFSPRQLERSRRSTVARKARAANAGASMRSVWTASAAYTKVISK